MSSSNDDARTFRRAMTGVRPRAPAPLPPRPPRPRAVARFSRGDSRATLHEHAPGSIDGAHVDEHGAVQFRRPGLRDSLVRDLRRGRIAVEGEIDLHGLARHSAHVQLREFLGLAVARRLRCIRVIHGKGLRSGAGGPVLKLAVSDWLAHLEDVQAFTSARPVDGGTGALYVLLRVRDDDPARTRR